MCTDLKVTYRCGHFQSYRTQCATYRKQQSSFKNILFGRYRNCNDCGKVRYSYQDCGGECTACVIALEGFKTEVVGHGAAMLHRQIIDETFRWTEQNRARDALKREEKSVHSKDRRHKHDVICSSNSVWAGEMYYKKPPVQQVSYSREYTPAPPVAPHRADGCRPQKPSRRHQSPRSHDKNGRQRKHGARDTQMTQGWEYRDPKATSGTREASFSWPHRKPAESKRARTHSSRARADPHSNWPLPDDRLQIPPTQAQVAYSSMTIYEDEPVNVRQVSPITHAPAYFQVYLNAYKSMPQRELRLSPERITQIASSAEKKGHAKKSSLKGLALAIGLGDDSDNESDLSFVCARAREEERRYAPSVDLQ